MPTIQDLLQEKAALVAEMRSSLDANPGDKWNAELEKSYVKKNTRLTEIDSQCAAIRSDETSRAERAAALDASEKRSREFGNNFRDNGNKPEQRGSHDHGHGMAFTTAEGAEIRSLASTDCVSSRSDQEMSVGRCLRAILLNDTASLSEAEKRSMLGSVDSNGGYLLNGGLSTNIVDLARSASVCIRAGAQTLTMNTAELNIARLATDPTSAWRAESVAVNASSATFDRIRLVPRTLAAIVPVSLEMMEDVANLPSILQSALTNALGLKMDQAALIGTGAASEPLGIRNHTNVNTVAGVGTPANFTKVTTAVGNILSANYNGDTSGLSWILHPRDAQTFDGLADTTGQPLQPTPWVSSLKRFHTTSLPTTESTNQSVSIIGDFQQLLFGVRSNGVVLRVMDAGTASDGTNTINATSQLMRFVVAHIRVDVAVLRPTWFSVLTGITA